ncbi:MAG: NADH:quinone oxidoreductase subunit N [Candidatus Syntrophoarchaeum butanivorans]|uniref:NADH:quinone oxidoreductase subunit N n=2 Tax=Candidatus Syntropharchaeum butanivorans TaxID=1839936 RepID=A0A1F2P577_9EURY|nr:MAG: NADH:quinone oxidoreductase subunit N [Candidatus Syntrophoarchaeum butanivorans]
MSYGLLLPELIIAASALIVLLDVFVKNSRGRFAGYVSIIAILVSLILVLKDGLVDPTPYFNDTIVVDSVSQIFNMIFLVVALLVVIAGVAYTEDKFHPEVFYSLLLFATLGMMIVAISNDLIPLFVGFELASLATYPMAAFERERRGIEASIKYFVIGGLSSAILLFGLSYIYGVTGTTNIPQIAETLSANIMKPASLLGLIFVVAGFGFKMALVPFHMWAIDVYDGAPHLISALLSSASKKMAFIAGFKVLIVGLIALRFDWYIGIALLAVITMTVGNVVAAIQQSVKRMLAYSSVAHAGYIAIAFVVISKSLEHAEIALAGGILHIFSHALMNGGAFILASIVAAGVIARAKPGEEDNLENYAGLGKVAPVSALLMAILMLSLGGVPPLFGFFSKAVIFLSAIKADLLWLAIIGVLNSALSLYYYARVVMYMYWKDPVLERVNEPLLYVLPVAIATVGVLLLGLYPPTYRWAFEAAHTLLQMGGVP